MSQTARAVADVSNDGWTPTPLYAHLQTTNDSDSITSPALSVSTFVVRLAPVAPPAVGGGQPNPSVAVRLKGPGTVLVEFLQGTTLIASQVVETTSAFAPYTLTVTDDEAAKIVYPSDGSDPDLRVRVTAYTGSSSSGSSDSGSSSSSPPALPTNSCTPPNATLCTEYTQTISAAGTHYFGVLYPPNTGSVQFFITLFNTSDSGIAWEVQRSTCGSTAVLSRTGQDTAYNPYNWGLGPIYQYYVKVTSTPGGTYTIRFQDDTLSCGSDLVRTARGTATGNSTATLNVNVPNSDLLVIWVGCTGAGITDVKYNGSSLTPTGSTGTFGPPITAIAEYVVAGTGSAADIVATSSGGDIAIIATSVNGLASNAVDGWAVNNTGSTVYSTGGPVNVSVAGSYAGVCALRDVVNGAPTFVAPGPYAMGQSVALPGSSGYMMYEGYFTGSYIKGYNTGAVMSVTPTTWWGTAAVSLK